MIFRLIIYITFLTVILPITSRSQTHRSEFFKKFENGLVLYLLLGDHFKDDSADIYIENRQLFQNIKLNSNPSDGLTDAAVEIRRNEKGQYRAEIFRGDTIHIEAIPNIVKVKIVLNGKPLEYTVNINNGKYVWFTKEKSSNLTLYQSQQMPAFD